MADLLEMETVNAVFRREELTLSGYVELVAFRSVTPHQPYIGPFNHAV